MRVLLVAEAANPEWVSVPLVGWAHAQAIAARTDAHIVTQVRNAAAFRRAGVADPAFTALDTEHIARPMWQLGSWLRGGDGKGWTTMMALEQLTYRSFERQLWRRFGKELRQGRFDLVHRITPLSPTIPSRLATWCRRAGVPFVLGPLNGGVPWPRGFDGARRREKEWLSYVRGLHRWLPGYRSTRRDAAAILVGSRDTWAQMPERYRDRCVYLPENAVDPARYDLDTPLAPRAPGPLRVAFLGRLVPYKGADMLLEAAAPLLAAGRLRIDVIGDGPERPKLEALAQQSGGAANVTFAGWLAHTEVAKRLAAADVLGFPSIREFGGGVVLEAMALGVVPVVVDYGGPAELVTAATGHAVPIGPRAQIIAQFRAVLDRLSADPAQLQPQREAARARIREQFTWAQKAAQTLQVYAWVLGQAPKPDFGMPLGAPAG